MSESPNLAVTYAEQNQSDGETTFNEFLNAMDAIVMLTVKDRDLSAPPGGESNGECWLVSGTGSGDWTGEDGNVAIYYDGWIFKTPKEGWWMYVADEDIFTAYNGSAWVDEDARWLPLSGGTLSGNLDLDGHDLVMDADGDTFFHESADDVIELRTVSNALVMTWDGSLATPGPSHEEGNEYWDTDHNSYWDYGADSVTWVVNANQRGNLTAQGLKLIDNSGGSAKLLLDNTITSGTGQSGFFTFTGVADAAGSGTAPSLASNTPNGGSGGSNLWLRIYDDTDTIGWLAFWN